jgi:toxin ParE1/3/4
MNFRLLPLARREQRKAIRYYECERAGLGDRFLAELRHAYDVVCRDPLAVPLYEVAGGLPNARRQMLKSFPYYVVFVVDDDGVLVLAVAHTARRPGYWRRRYRGNGR